MVAVAAVLGIGLRALCIPQAIALPLSYTLAPETVFDFHWQLLIIRGRKQGLRAGHCDARL